ncbi:MAG: resuscitation-promoting factor RpfA [Actinomycetota bacterium]|nr:resuscitation-promoting factor RpfA [Actinomycetota bacterium]
MTRGARFLRLMGWAAGIALALYVLSVSGRGELSPPPIGSPGRWPTWLEGREPAAAAFAILRLVAVGGCWYLAATTVVGTILRLLRADVLVAVADRITVAPVRHLLAGSLTLTLSGIGPTAALAATQPAPTTTTTTSVTTTSVVGAPATVTMVRLPPAGAEPEAPPNPAEPSSPATRYTVVSGDCFWTIADDLLHRTWGRAPTDAEIVPYWLRLIEVNRSELADPGNADLIFPGQVFTVPPLAAPPA